MACAVSTDPTITLDTRAFEVGAAWELHPKVQIRPERFGALLYHFGTRRLSFVKSLTLLSVLERLADSANAREAMDGADVAPDQAGSIERALATLARSEMICRQAPLA